MCNSQLDVPGLAQRVSGEKQAPPRSWITPTFLDGCLWKKINFFLMSLSIHQVCRELTATRPLGLWQEGINPTWLSKCRQHCLSHFLFLKRLSSFQWRDHFHFHQSFGWYRTRACRFCIQTHSECSLIRQEQALLHSLISCTALSSVNPRWVTTSP